MELEILLPFPSAETMTESWAFSEAQIDFRHDPEAGARCTISYAAVELRTHLLQMEPDAQICFVSQRHNGKQRSNCTPILLRRLGTHTRCCRRRMVF